MTRGDSSAAEHTAPDVRSEVTSPPPRSTHTPGPIVAAPMPFGALWGIYDERTRCFGTIGEPHGRDNEVVEANARRLVRAWNNYDATLGLVLDLAADVRIPKDLRERARQLLVRFGGPQ